MVSEEVLDLEMKGDLAGAYAILKRQWYNGNRDRDVGLHLMFDAWYGLIEPRQYTNFMETDAERSELNEVLFEVHEFFAPTIKDDVEMLYVVGVMAHMFWFMFEHDRYWEQVSKDYHARYRELAPDGIDPTIFDGRGYYGEYYGGQARVENGY